MTEYVLNMYGTLGSGPYTPQNVYSYFEIKREGNIRNIHTYASHMYMDNIHNYINQPL